MARMPTWARPWTSCFWAGLWPCTSAEGLSTRRYSAGRRNRSPSSKSISSAFSAVFSRISTGQCTVSNPPQLFAAAPPMPAPSQRRRWRMALGERALRVAQRAGLVDEHDRNAVADRIGETGLVADQLLRRPVIAQRPLGQRADQDLQELGVDIHPLLGAGSLGALLSWAGPGRGLSWHGVLPLIDRLNGAPFRRRRCGREPPSRPAPSSPGCARRGRT